MQDDPLRALADYTKAVEKHPQSPAARFHRGVFLLSRKVWADALSDFRVTYVQKSVPTNAVADMRKGVS